MITEVKIQNFRGIKSLELKDLSKVNIFVGGNSVGKTSILEAICCAASGGAPNTALSISRQRGFLKPTYKDSIGITSMFPDLNPYNKIRVDLVWKKEPVLFEAQGFDSNEAFNIVSDKFKNAVSFSSLTYNPESEASRGSEKPVAKIGFGYAQKIFGGHNGHYSGITLYQDNSSTSEDLCSHRIGEDLIWPSVLLNRITEKSNDVGSWDAIQMRLGKLDQEQRLEPLITILKTICPNLKSLSFAPVITPNGRDFRIMADTGGRTKFPVSILGEGFIWGMALFATCLTRATGVVAIDEIDNGLHHTSMENIWKGVIRLQQHAAETQMFCTTHSEELLEKTLRPFAGREDDLRIFRVGRTSNGNIVTNNLRYEDIAKSKNPSHGKPVHIT